jgi:hypothetical protein
MAAFMEWQQRLDGGHWLEREWLGDDAEVVVDHGAINDRNKVPSGRAEPHLQHGSRFLAYIKLPITALGWRSLKASLGAYTFFGLDEVFARFRRISPFLLQPLTQFVILAS